MTGQTSSGKSTLMNLFLGEDILPSETLSCTATICELAYGDEKAAQVPMATPMLLNYLTYADNSKCYKSILKWLTCFGKFLNTIVIK